MMFSSSTPVPVVRVSVPMYRAYHKESKCYVEGELSTTGQFIPRMPVIGIMNIVIDLFTGKVAEDGQPVYENDEVEFGTPNEFGSMAIAQGLVKYSTEHMAFLIMQAVQPEDANTFPLPTKILKVLGRKYD